MKAESLAERLLRTRSETMISELEATALRLFEERGFSNVTVDDIGAEAGISARTFYRYFPTKEDVLLVRIDRRAEALRAALTERPAGEPLLHSVRVGLEEAISAEDTDLLRRWIAINQATPGVLRTVLGGNLLKINQSMAEFFVLGSASHQTRWCRRYWPPPSARWYRLLRGCGSPMVEV